MLAMNDETEPEDTINTYEELSNYTKTELLEIASEMGIEGLSMNNLKDEIINAILEAE